MLVGSKRLVLHSDESKFWEGRTVKTIIECEQAIIELISVGADEEIGQDATGGARLRSPASCIFLEGPSRGAPD